MRRGFHRRLYENCTCHKTGIIVPLIAMQAQVPRGEAVRTSCAAVEDLSIDRRNSGGLQSARNGSLEQPARPFEQRAEAESDQNTKCAKADEFQQVPRRSSVPRRQK
jgi:hypothetical protein